MCPRRLRVLLTAALAAGCARGSSDSCEVAQLSEALIGGYELTDYLGITSGQVDAVVALEFDLDSTIPFNLCSGAALDSDTIVTAAHCFDILPTALRIKGRTWQRNLSWGEVTLALNPEQDIAIVRSVALRAPKFLGWHRDDPTEFVGQLVEIAGAGLSSDGTAGHVEFAVARVLASDSSSLTVALAHGGGPCGGDSGGPLLVRGGSGEIEVAGILSDGPPTCQGPDRYTRLDIADTWLSARIAQANVGESDCSTLGERGRCFEHRAVWCEDGVTKSLDCNVQQACGFDTARRQMRCIPLAADHCRGVSEFGQCSDASAVRCVDGSLEQLDCQLCGGVCAISSRSGHAVCATAPPGE